jgi:glutamine synthetase
LHYRDDVLQAADDLIRLKRILRSQARAHGVTACFMAKPFEHYAGSGMHFHVSLHDGRGENVFAEREAGQWSDTLLHALGGLRDTMLDPCWSSCRTQIPGAASQSVSLRDALGEDIHRTFTAVKAAEYARVNRTIPELDFDLYLHTV